MTLFGKNNTLRPISDGLVAVCSSKIVSLKWCNNTLVLSSTFMCFLTFWRCSLLWIIDRISNLPVWYQGGICLACYSYVHCYFGIPNLAPIRVEFHGFHVDQSSVKCFTGGGSKRIGHPYTVSTILVVGQAAKPYLPTQSTVDSSRRSTNCKMLPLHCIG